ncbi:hypothetical protein C8A01DRAFT_14913 [Parachaetomium inaequale]|uniref:Uncharacterized protein n=1 Tax=Parachaetomium inaequale TaxID=2588326 RepID=A0AAN6PIL1_9PEZI|nr:hypothetical protein C8A01DRAFT_14913 [Parachaetomium inaequale]
MGALGSTTVLRGFKVSTAVLDAFLAANGLDETYGAPPFYQHHPDNDRISVLLHTKIAKVDAAADKKRFRVMMPAREGHGNSEVAYITHSWVSVYAHRELNMDEDLPADVPAGFEELRQEVLSFCGAVPDAHKMREEGRMGLYVVYTYEIQGLYSPQEFLDRAKVPQQCDRCDAEFDDGPYPHLAFYKRQLHRRDAHGCREGTSPLPDA